MHIAGSSGGRMGNLVGRWIICDGSLEQNMENGNGHGLQKGVAYAIDNKSWRLHFSCVGDCEGGSGHPTTNLVALRSLEGPHDAIRFMCLSFDLLDS